jgi:hypothetical protein
MIISLSHFPNSILKLILGNLESQFFFCLALTCKKILSLAKKDKRKWKIDLFTYLFDEPHNFRFISPFSFPVCVCGQRMIVGSLFQHRGQEKKKVIIGPCCLPFFNSQKECERCGRKVFTKDYCHSCSKVTFFSSGKYLGEKWVDVILVNPFYVNNYIDFNPDHKISQEIKRVYGPRCSFTKCFLVKKVKVYLNDEQKICRATSDLVDLFFSKGKLTRRTKEGETISVDRDEIEKKRRMIRGWLIRDKISKTVDVDFDWKIEQKEVMSKEYIYL